MAVLKALMQGDDSEPDGQNPGEVKPNTDEDGNVEPAKTIDLEKLDIKDFRKSETKTTGGQKND
jgi:hypothetical protein